MPSLWSGEAAKRGHEQLLRYGMVDDEKDDKYLPDDDGSSEKPDEPPPQDVQHDPATDEVPG